MKLIMEGWRLYLDEQELNEGVGDVARAGVEKLKRMKARATGRAQQAYAQKGGYSMDTMEDLKIFVNAIIDTKNRIKTGELSAEAGGKILKGFINAASVGFLDFAGAARKGAELGGMLLKVGTLPDEKTEASPFLAAFNINDEYQKLLDDKIENAFIMKLKTDLDSGALDDVNIRQFDINNYLEDFLKQTFDQKTVTGAAPTRIKTAKANIAMQNLAMAGAKGALKGAASQLELEETPKKKRVIKVSNTSKTQK